MKKYQPALPSQSAFKAEQSLKQAEVSKFIYQVGESPILRKPSKEMPVKDIASKKTREKINYIKKCLLKYRKITGMGHGLAAVQVGIPEAIAVIYTPDHLITIINPKITKESPTLLKYPEMCMSSAPLITYITRPSWIEFKYFDEKGEKQHWNNPTDKMLNRVFQHEIDHLKGILNIDRIKSSQDIALLSDPKFYEYAAFKELTPDP